MKWLQAIHTEFLYPPIADRRWDWSAMFDGHEPGDPMGLGPTEDEAIADLVEQTDSLWAGYEEWIDRQAEAWDAETDR